MREQGYYWVKINNDWEIAEWSIYWERIGYETVLDDSAFEEIDERRIERDEFSSHKLGYTPDQL